MNHASNDAGRPRPTGPPSDPGSPASGNRWWNQVPSRKIAIGAIILAAVVLFAHKASLAVGDPFFGGDAAHRMNHARVPVAPMDYRIWLPALQAHICAIYYSRLPIPAFKLISPVYFFLAVLILGSFAYRYAGKNYASLSFSLLLMVCFAYQRTMASLGTQLYQEMMGAAMLFALLWGGALELRKSKWLLLAGCAAMLTRDSFWIYLFALTALNLRTIVRDSKLRLSFLLLWAIPALWLLSIPAGYLFFLGRLPEIPMEWPLMINKHNSEAVTSLAASAEHLYRSMAASQVLPLLAGVVAAWVIVRLRRQPEMHVSCETDSFLARFAPFSLLSLGIIYVLIFVFDPWQATQGSTRLVAPLIDQAFVWAVILFKMSSGHRPPWRVLSRVALVAGMVLAVDTRAHSWIPVDHSRDRRNHAEIRKIIEETGRHHTPMVCFAGEEYFTALKRFVAPSLRAYKWVMAPGEDISGRGCEIFIIPEDHDYEPGDEFRKRGVWTIDKVPYKIYAKDPDAR